MTTSNGNLSKAASDVISERQRQLDSEGWTPVHDDKYVNGELVAAAGNYLGAVTFQLHGLDPAIQRDEGGVYTGWHCWPWSAEWWKPSEDPRRNLVKAAALILAEIERLDRAAGR